jgi:hypothetical protein
MLWDDDRGQSIQIGAILLFGVLVIGLAVTQTVVVPAENGGVEFNSYTEATNDLVRLQQGVLAAGTGGGYASATVRTGVRYPSRAVLINPGPPAGSLTTTPSTNVSIDGVEAVSGEEDNVRGFWNTSTRGARNYSTRSVVFSPAYNEIDVPPVEVSGQGAYRRTANGPLALTGETFLSGNRITLVTIDGDLDSAGLSTPVTATPASVSTRSVTVTGSESEFLVTLPVPGNGTAAAATAWNRSRAADSIRSNPHVLDTEVTGSRVDVTFDGTRQYELRLARVVVHDRGDSGIDPDTEPQYVVAVDGNGTTVPTTGTRRVAVEVRDRYNNPVEGATVDFDATGGSVSGSDTVVTGGDGRAQVQFDIDDDVPSARLDATIVGEGVSGLNSTTIELVRAGADGGDAGNNINPNSVNGLVLREATISSSTCGGNVDCRVDFELENLDTDDAKNVTEVQFAFYSVDRQSSGNGNQRDAPAQLELIGSGTTLQNRGSFEPIGRVVDPGQSTTIGVRFEDRNGQNFDEVIQGDFFVLTTLIDNDGDGSAEESANYFIAPE